MGKRERHALTASRFAPAGLYKPLCYEMWPYKVNGSRRGGGPLPSLRSLWPFHAGRSRRGLHVFVRPASPAAAALLVALGDRALDGSALVAAHGHVEVELAEVGRTGVRIRGQRERASAPLRAASTSAGLTQVARTRPLPRVASNPVQTYLTAALRRDRAAWARWRAAEQVGVARLAAARALATGADLREVLERHETREAPQGQGPAAAGAEGQDGQRRTEIPRTRYCTLCVLLTHPPFPALAGEAALEGREVLAEVYEALRAVLVLVPVHVPQPDPLLQVQLQSHAFALAHGAQAD